MATEKKIPTIDDYKGLPPDPTTKSGVPKHVVEALVRTFLPDIIAFFESKEGRREFEEWEREQERLKQQSEEQERL